MSDDGVVLLHGIMRTARSMAPMARLLEKKGYKILNLGYPSTRFPLETLAAKIHGSIQPFAQSLPGSIHFVGFSMGGLLIRAYLPRYAPANTGRIVMLGTPNHGSEVADRLRKNFIYRKFYGPAGQQLITDQQSFRHIFGDVGYELGIIAGNRSLDPISSWLISQPNDGKVSVESTRLAEAADHITLPCSHTFFPQSKLAQQQTLHFLQH